MSDKNFLHTPEAPCPIACAAQLIGDKWILLIIRDLMDGPRRFGDLQHSVTSFDTSTPINSKTLTDRLKQLEEEALIHRKAYEHEKPPRVEYSLTQKGMELSEIIQKLREFGERYMMQC